MSCLAEYVAQLEGEDEAERTYAAEDIGYLNCVEGVPALLERLHREPSRTVRDAIFQALIRMDGDAVIEGAVGLFASDDPQIRNQAVDLLRRKGARAIPFLSPVMRVGNKDVRKLVLDVLGGLPAGDAREIYEAALVDADVNVVITAVENLGRSQAGGFRVEIENLLRADAHPMLMGACLEALVGIGHRGSLDTLRRCFPDLGALPDFLLASCLKAMAALGAEREFAEVARLLSVRGLHLRPAILSALVAICGRLAVESAAPEPDEALLATLRTVIEGGEPALCRYQAVRVAGYWVGREDVYEFLVGCLSSPERLVRLGASEALKMSARLELEAILRARTLEETDVEVLQALSC